MCSRYNGLMRQFRFILSWVGWGLAVGLITLGLGCQSDKQKYPEDHARYERIINAVEALRSAYKDRNTDAFGKLLLTSEGLQRLQSDVQGDVSAYSSISLTMTIERIYVRDERATVNVRWEGKWQPSSEEKLVTDQGHGILIWHGTETVLLEEVGGNVPFGMAARQAMSSAE